MMAEFISPDDSRWRNLLDKVDHDFYHLPEYILFAGRHEEGTGCAFFADSGDSALLVPLLMRPLPESLGAEADLCDVLTPYGYPGPILAGNPAQDTVALMLKQFFRLGRENGVVSAFWRLHPLLKFPHDVLGAFGSLVQHGRTVYIDLSLSPEEHWRETSNNHRRHINSLKKKGFTVVRNDENYWPAFLDIYRESMNRVEASDFYLFSDDYFNELRVALGERLDVWTVLSPEGEVAAAAMFTAESGIVQYHLGATSEKYLELSPIKLLISEVRSWGREAGHRYMHLGGGVGGAANSLYTFKSRFSPLSVEFHTFRTVLLQDAYDELTKKRFGGQEGPSDAATDFFPAYRTPV